MLDFYRQKNEISKCAIYIRVSTTIQVKEGYGLDMQKRNCEALALVKGWEVVKVYADEGISGTTIPSQRPGLKQLIIDARNKMFQAVIFYSLDRIGRTLRIALDTIEYLEIMKIKCISHKENIDTSDDAGIFVLAMFSAIAELERKTIISRLCEGKKDRALIDGEIGGVLPYGYWRVNKKVEINDKQAEVIRYVYYKKSQNYTLKKIAQMLDKKDIKPSKGEKWNPSSIRKILMKKDIYLGGYRNGSKITWPKILSDSYAKYEFTKKRNKVNDRRDEHKRVKEEAEKRGINMAFFDF